jgi:hypothetical protein
MMVRYSRTACNVIVITMRRNVMGGDPDWWSVSLTTERMSVELCNDKTVASMAASGWKRVKDFAGRFSLSRALSYF